MLTFRALNRRARGMIHIGAFACEGSSGAPTAAAAVTGCAPVTAASPSSGCGDERNTKGESPVQSRTFSNDGNNGTYPDFDGTPCSWSIQSALQMAYPPAPLVTGFHAHCPRLLSPRYFRHCNLLSLPDSRCTASLGVAQGGSATVSGGSARAENWDAAVGGSSSTLLLLLHDIATLPWAAGSRLTLSLHGAATCTHDETMQKNLLATAAVKRSGNEDHGSSSGAPAIAGVRGRVPTQSRTTSAVDRAVSLRRSDAEGEGQGNVSTSLSAVTAAGHESGREAWQPFTEYSDPQACSETSALALRSFVVSQLGQRVPLLALVAEKACDANSTFSSLAERCVTDRTSTAHGQECSSSPAWIPPHTAVHRMPVEVYAERIPLVQTRGTALLQQALWQALKRVLTATAGHNKHGQAHLPASLQPSPSTPCGERRWSIAPLVHLIWNGSCWVGETDVQVMEMEERLLSALLGSGDDDTADATAGVARPSTNRSLAMCRTPATQGNGRERGDAGRIEALESLSSAQGSAYPRFWLPSCWRHVSGSAAVLTPLVLDNDNCSPGIGARRDCPVGAAATAASRCPLSSRPYEVWKDTTEDRRAPEAIVKVAAAAPEGGAQIPATLRCSQWVLRLRKTWLVASPNVKSPLLIRAGAVARAGVSMQPSLGDAGVKPVSPLLDAARGASGHSCTPSSRPPAPAPVRYPNYDLLTGLPLNLRDYDSAAKRARDAARGHCSSSTPKSAMLSSWPSRTISTPPAHECGVQAMQASAFQYTDDPFFVAAISQQVGWVPLSTTCNPHTLHVGASSASTSMDAPGTGSVSWQLPDALRSHYRIPSSITDVPQRWLCSATKTATETDAPTTAAASSTASAQHVPSLLPLPPVASVSVPQHEWWTGFFLHDAPHWWRREVLKRAQQCRDEKRMSKGRVATSLRPRHDLNADRVANVEEVATILSFLQQECCVSRPPVSTFGTAAAVASPHQDAPALMSDPSSLVEMTQNRATLPPQVCVLRLAPVAPALRRPRPSLRRGNQVKQDHHCVSTSATEALALELQWSLVPDTAVVTVNTFFSLSDVVDHAGLCGTEAGMMPPTLSADRVVLFYVEVKAALEVLRRVTRAAVAWEDSPEEADGSSSPDWWTQLSAFYDAHMFVAKDASPPATMDKDGRVSDGGRCEKVGTTHRGAVGDERTVPAFCHPTVTEVVRTCVQLMLQCGGPSQNRHVSDLPSTLDSCGREGNRVSSESVAVWSRLDYNALLRTAVITPAGAAVTPSSTTFLHSEMVDGDSDKGRNNEEADAERAEKAAPGHEDDYAAYTEKGSASPLAGPTDMQEAQSPGTVRGVEAQCSRAHAASAHHNGLLVAEMTQSSPLASPCSLQGVELYEYNEDGTRREPCISCGSLRVSPNETQSLVDAPDDRSAVDRRALLGSGYRLSEGYQPRRTHDSLGAVSAAGHAASSGVPLPSTDLPSAFLLSGKSVQPMTLSAACIASILDAQNMAKKKSGDAVADAGPQAPRQLRSDELLFQNEESLCSESSQGYTDSASPMPSPTGGESSLPLFDVMDMLIAEEHRRFKSKWRSWLRYLPVSTTHPRNTPSTGPEAAGLQTRVSRVFGFLQPSAASEYCTGSSSRAEIASGRGDGEGGHANGSAPNEATAAATSDGAVAVLDLGLCVLHVCRTEVYVNAANLLCHEETCTEGQAN
ncbi:hypothetical protein, unknown function [Leishmania tarentolae]|uniref:Uncharacterized protein n=1 Tax=Leishmania tarentolae TaxID=5689 RepID=A0A640KEB6_LEITA|nr:hypothetical protein, unknown function [Leishmania tarentolae]